MAKSSNKSVKTKKIFDSAMVDLETMGNLPGCVIVSIGAVEFDIRTGETGREFRVLIDMKSCIDAGLTVQASTVEWWMKQSQEARDEFTKGKKYQLESALLAFTKWFTEDSTSRRIWGNGSGFDCSILKMAYEAVKLEAPWGYDKERDLRTIMDLNPVLKYAIPFQGVKHEPVADCKHQIKQVCAVYKNNVIEPKINKIKKKIK